MKGLFNSQGGCHPYVENHRPRRSQGGACLRLHANKVPRFILLSVALTGALTVGQGHTRVDGLVAGEVAFVAEGSLAAVTLVWFVAVCLQRVPLE